uniref:Cytosolic carboxypeptidase N-terminal domain-containing protein n=1 Tax=Crocodylus porosus TaxID=8502 RepID=A0A7M4FJF8_CROPO
YAVLPPGYCGQPKKGHLIFDACFESGNLGRVDHITEFEYDLFIRPDTCNPRFRVWFNFTVENIKESQVSSKWSQIRTFICHINLLCFITSDQFLEKSTNNIKGVTVSLKTYLHCPSKHFDGLKSKKLKFGEFIRAMHIGTLNNSNKASGLNSLITNLNELNK